MPVSEQNHGWPDNVSGACPIVISSPVPWKVFLGTAISRLTRPLFKNWRYWIWPAVLSRPAFINDMQFSVIFSGWFIITDPRRPRGSLSGWDDFPLRLASRSLASVAGVRKGRERGFWDPRRLLDLRGWLPYKHYPKLQYNCTVHLVVQHPSYSYVMA